MAQNIITQVLGGSKSVMDGVSTIADIRAKLSLGANYSASIDGEPASDSSEVVDGNYVSFAHQVKGA